MRVSSLQRYTCLIELEVRPTKHLQLVNNSLQFTIPIFCLESRRNKNNFIGMHPKQTDSAARFHFIISLHVFCFFIVKVSFSIHINHITFTIEVFNT